MGDQHHALQDRAPSIKKRQLFNQALFFAVGKEVTGEAGSAARDHEAIAARKPQAVVQEIVALAPRNRPSLQ